MFKKFVGILSTLLFTSGILVVSVFQSSNIDYAFAGPEEAAKEPGTIEIEYKLPYPGPVLPDHPAWPVKAARDKLWLTFSSDPFKKAELNILFADKRIAASKILFERDKPELGYSSLTKAEKYLEGALKLEKEEKKKGRDTKELLDTLALASLKHVQVSEEILSIAPADAKPMIVRTMEYPKEVYREVKRELKENGNSYPENPFDWE